MTARKPPQPEKTKMTARPAPLDVKNDRQAPTTPVVVPKPALPATANLSYEEDAGAGLEHVAPRDMLVPFLAILQPLSPQVNDRGSEYVEGARAGMIINTATNRLYDGEAGVEVLMASFKRRYTEWVPRSKGGGMVRDWDDDESWAKTAQRDPERVGLWHTSDGHEITVSGTHYVVVLDEGNQPLVAVIAMSGTQQKKSRSWVSLVATEKMARQDGSFFTPPSFARVYRLTTIPESNDKGSWFGWKIAPGPLVSTVANGAVLYDTAKKFRQDVLDGKVKIQPETDLGVAEEEVPL